jgi:hypothetical protein
VDRFRIRIKDDGATSSTDIGQAIVMLDTEHEEEREVALDTQGTVTLKFKITHLNGVMP